MDAFGENKVAANCKLAANCRVAANCKRGFAGDQTGRKLGKWLSTNSPSAWLIRGATALNITAQSGFRMFWGCFRPFLISYFHINPAIIIAYLFAKE
ncbi:hypothetical protein MAR_033969 [Mya arenaria]|uniref:Uncharacterized protein n=1 Tax=Mya arenaria TaxID=6604 RepID=A0ABY7GBX9_MYAAR|nr:hypothetical protein MAR_033969 [Mya arenaria]